MRILTRFKWLATLLVSAALAFSSAGFAADNNKAAVAKVNATNTSKAVTSTAAKKAQYFLFVLYAKQGKIVTEDGKTYLVLKKADVYHALMYSDRPYRLVKYITGSDLQALWKEDKDSFEKDPPNAVLSSAGQKAQIVILSSLHVKGDEVRFVLSPDVASGRSLSDVTLAVDKGVCVSLRDAHYSSDAKAKAAWISRHYCSVQPAELVRRWVEDIRCRVGSKCRRFEGSGG